MVLPTVVLFDQSGIHKELSLILKRLQNNWRVLVSFSTSNSATMSSYRISHSFYCGYHMPPVAFIFSRRSFSQYSTQTPSCWDDERDRPCIEARKLGRPIGFLFDQLYRARVGCGERLAGGQALTTSYGAIHNEQPSPDAKGAVATKAVGYTAVSARLLFSR